LRPFEKLLDYPKVLVHKVEIHRVAEVIDWLSEEASKVRLASRDTLDDELAERKFSLQGINRTPEIAAAYESKPVQNYFGTLLSLEGKIVSPRELLPKLEPDKTFKHAYPLPGTKLYLVLSEAAPQQEERIAQVAAYSMGPNLGSAGGPTLQHLAALASIYYEGRLETQPLHREA
jgi:hypothetical protein